MDKTQIEERIALAHQMHSMSYNCAQCVALATCDLVGLDKDQLFRVMEGFGGGMGGFTQTCGGLTGGIAVVSQASCNGMEACNSKQKTYGYVAQLVEEFGQACGSACCADLRPDEPELRMTVCNKFIAKGVELTIATLDKIKEDEEAACK